LWRGAGPSAGYIHSDARGSVVARTALAKTGTAVTTPDSKAEYGAWGDTVAYSGVSVPRYQYTNEEPDPGTGYYYFGARPYDPTLRRKGFIPSRLSLPRTPQRQLLRLRRPYRSWDSPRRIPRHVDRRG